MSPRKSRQLHLLRQATKRVAASSFPLYCRLLAQLLYDHRHHEFLRPLSDALRRKDYKGLYASSDSLSKQQYRTATEHYVANQFTLLIKKYPWDPKLLGFDPERAAFDNFQSGEIRCGRVNRKFDLLKNDPSRDKFRAEGKLAMSWIRGLIGSRPDLKAIWSKCEFGQGASIGVHGDATHVIRKISDEQEWSVTPSAIHYAFGGLMRNHHYLEALLPRRENSDGRTIFSVDYAAAFNSYTARLDIVEHNKISFVPKTAKTHRSIAVEPCLNGFVQKGIDLVLRRKLLSVGLDLSDQSRNQRMAREGSRDDSDEGYVTIDLRNASNSLARSPIMYLLPPAWFELLDRTRSKYYEHRGAVKRYNMLCSMGNGFCFPIETLMFAAICHAVGAGTPGVDFSVYGDDIIVRKRHGAAVLSMLKHYGFQANIEKTFLEGPFRESCGADWFNDEDVRPFTLDFAFDRVDSFFKYLNLTRRSERTSEFFASVRPLIIGALPLEYRFFRPFQGNVDTGIDTSGDEHLSSPHCQYVQVRFSEPRPGFFWRWEWQELHLRPVADEARMQWWRYEPWLIGVALRGNPSRAYGELAGLPEVTYRRKTRAEITRESYSATSNWLPTNPSFLERGSALVEASE